MVNDLKKLNKVIDSLEEQAAQVGEFNGVLSAVNDARSKIEEAKAVLNSLADEHRLLIQDQSQKFEGFLKRFAEFEQELADLRKTQDQLVQTISKLDVVSPKQFQQEQKKLLSTLAKIEQTVRTAQKDSVRASQEAVKAGAEVLAQQITEAEQSHRASLDTLRTVNLLGLLVLAVGVAVVIYLLST